MRKHLFVVAFVLVAAASVMAQSSGSAPAKSNGAFAIYANVGSGWWGGSDFQDWIDGNLGTIPTLKASNAISYSVGFLDRIGGNPLYFELGIGIGGFTGGWDTSAQSFSVSYFSFPFEMSLGLAIPIGRVISLMAQAGVLLNMHLTADYSFVDSSGTYTGSLESDTDFALFALSIPIAAGIEIALSPSFKMDILAMYQLGIGDLNFLDTGAVYSPSSYWGNLTENQFTVRCSLVFPFAPRSAAGKGSQPSTGVQR